MTLRDQIQQVIDGEPVAISRRPKARLAADLLDLFSRALANRDVEPAPTSH